MQQINAYDYKEYYQKQKQQEMQQYSYPLPSSSSNQLTLPLTRSLYHSSAVSPLQTSLVHTNSTRHISHQHRKEGSINDGNGNGHISESVSLSLLQGERLDLDLTYDYQSSRSRQSGTGQRRSERKKYRKHERKTKHRRSGVDGRNRSTDNSSVLCETSFGRIQELGIPESYKISYPHYYEDNSADCPSNYSQNQQRTPKRYADNNSSFLEPTPSIAAPVNQYPQLHFRDVGQEIDV